MPTYRKDSAAAAAAQTLERSRAVHAAAEEALKQAEADLAQLESAAPAPYDRVTAELGVSMARALDAVNGTTVAEMAQAAHDDADRAAIKASDDHAALVAAARSAVAERSILLEGARRVLVEAAAASKACTAVAAREALQQARARYREAAIAVLGLASDVWALETLTQLDTWPDSRALSTRFAEVPLPAFGAFSLADLPDLAEVGGRFEPLSDTVSLTAEKARVQAMADLHSIRAQLEGETQQ